MADSPPLKGQGFNEEYETSSASNRHPSHLRGRAIGLWYAQRRRPGSATQTPSRSRPPSTQPVATIELSPMEMERVTGVRQLFPSQGKRQENNASGSARNTDIDLEDNTFDSDPHHTVQFDKLHSSFQYFEQLDRRPHVDQSLFDDLEKKQKTPLYQKLNHDRARLPITDYRARILDRLKRNQIFILVGETGSGECLSHRWVTSTIDYLILEGKTTQTAQFILDEQIQYNRGSQCRIICSQPRRISGKSTRPAQLTFQCDAARF